MNILLIEPFFTGSHAAWAEGLQHYSNHRIEVLKMSGHYWKWRMHGGAVTLARKFMAMDFQPDLILATDMLDLSTFLALTREKTHSIPMAVYFHENQLTYPWSPDDQDVQRERDNHYSFINYTTALSADHIFFNSHFHQQSFFEELPKFLSHFPDNNELKTVELLKKKSSVLSLGMDLQKLDAFKPEKPDYMERALLLWNHRWEHDKNPQGFFEALDELERRGVDFRLAVLGENFAQSPEVFKEAKERLGEKVVHFGFVESLKDYAGWLWRADILPVTSFHDFFGASVVEAMYCDVKPLLPERLAYPEHIPEQYHPTFFYKDKRDFVNRLQRLIFDVKVIRKQRTGQFVQHYDWSVMGPVYDKAFAEMLEQ